MKRNKTDNWVKFDKVNVFKTEAGSFLTDLVEGKVKKRSETNQYNHVN